MASEEVVIGLTALLKSTHDWTNWEHAFWVQVYIIGLWDHIKNKTPLMRTPVAPDIRKTKYTKTASALREAAEVGADPSILDKANGEWTMSDLTDRGQKNFNLDYTYYVDRDTIYTRQHTKVEELTNWIMATISPHFLTTCCSAGEPLYKWYENLRARCG